MKKLVTAFCLCVIAEALWAQGSEANVTLTFEEAVKIGLEKNVILNQQKNTLMTAQAQKLNSMGNLMPNFSVTGGFQRQEGQQQNTTSGDLEDLSTDYFGAQLNANYNIFNGLRNINSYAQSNNLVNAQSYLIKRSTQDVVSNVALQYLQVLLDQELLRIAQENHKAQQATLDQTKGFYDVGARAITDFYTQDAQTKAAQVLVIRAKNTLVNDKALLSQTLQLDPSQDFNLVYPALAEDLKAYLNVSMDSLMAIAIEYRADLKQSNSLVEANKSAMRAAVSGYVPSVQLYANYGSFYYSLIQDDFSNQFKTLNPSLTYGANFTIPLFSRFLTRSQRVAAKVNYDNSILTKNNLEKTVKIDVQRSYNNLVNAIENYESSLSQFQAGELALRAQQESYNLGVSAQVVLAQANQTYVLGAAAKAQAEVTLLFQKIQLEYALGTLVPEEIQSK